MTDIDWNQSEDEVMSDGKDFVNAQDIPEDTYVIKFGELRHAPKTTTKGIPYFWLECQIVSPGPYQGENLDQIIFGPPDTQSHLYEDWAKCHNVSRGKVNRWVKALNLPPISRMSELEGHALQVEWKFGRKGDYKEFAHIQKPPPKTDFKPAPPKAETPAPERTAADQW